MSSGEPSGKRTGNRHRRFPVVGIGASAGGLDAFTELMVHLPLDTGLAFVLVQHLDPLHESALKQLLTRSTSMPVQEVTNNLTIEANHVYVIPPNTSMGIADGILKLQPRLHVGGMQRSIDFFLESLAQDQREYAIGVILSGTASDGTLGLEAIKAEGGITFAQDESAKYDSMPRSAVAAGCVDFVLSPKNIAKELAQIARHPLIAGGLLKHLADPPDEKRSEAMTREVPQPSHGRVNTKSNNRLKTARAPTAAHENNGYKNILLLLRNHCGVDFSLYKSSTINRRIARRTVLSKHETLESYADFLKGNAKELDALYSDALIGVTSFFRNSGAFDVLANKVFPKLLQQRVDEPLRVWVLGCSTGQEAYSIAMSFSECAEKALRKRDLQVFATDLNDANLESARRGLYSKSIVQDVSPERLRRFFVEEEAGYRVIKPLRELVVFARQNLISDPPFSRMDLISCRNLMIYLEPSLQKKVLSTFHYALKTGGFLFLGAAESIGGFTDLFEPVDKKQKIYARKTAPAQKFHLPVRRESEQHSPWSKASSPLAVGKGIGRGTENFRVELNPQHEADRVTVNQFAPPGVLINADLQILQFRGPTSAYLEPPTGKASFDLLKMARTGLTMPLRTAINKAKKENRTIRKENVPVKHDEKERNVNVEVIPLKNLKERCFLVLFEGSERQGPAAPGTGSRKQLRNAARTLRSVSKKEESFRVAELEQDLAEVRDYLQSTQEFQEAANEELQASNEESQSSNEELQSLNEELETSKEELESTNEELITVNEELAHRNADLNVLNSDLANLHASTKLPIVLLGSDLTIRRFSEQAEQQFNLRTSDVGRPLSSVRHNLNLPDLEDIIDEVISSASASEREVQDNNGHWFSLRVRPYMTLDDKADGAVLVLMDIDDLKRNKQLISEAWKHAEAIIRTVRDPLVILTADLRIHSANDAFYSAFKLSLIATEGRSILELDHGSWNIPRLRQLLEEIIPKNNVFNDLEVGHNFERIGHRTLLLNARPLNDFSGKPTQILLGIQDITEGEEFQTQLRRSELRYRRLFEAAKDGVLVVDPSSRKILDSNPFMSELLGYTRDELCGMEMFEIGLIKDQDASEAAFRKLLAEGNIRYESLPLQTKTGDRREVEFVSNLYYEDGEQIIQCNIRDITLRKQAEETLRQAQSELADRAGQLKHLVDERTAELTATNKQLEAFVYTIAHDLRAPLRAMQGFAKILHEDFGPKLNEEGDGYTVKIADAAKSLDRLLTDLLEYSRISQAKIVLQPVELESIVATVLEQCREKITESHAAIEVIRPLPNVLAYAPILTQVLMNLITNALKFVAAGVHPHIRISAETKAETTRIRIEDNGIGIATEHKERIFRIFERGHTKSFPGTGIGLAIVQRGMERMRGQVGVESTPGTGSRFWIELAHATSPST
ncbi:MAG TPA: chemotaxis protein CheB [Bacteroidota bacterium]|nr:chemotaxis protein CheB [Bacteroidota bacterium]